jgi:hypothetical protein
MIEDKLPHTAYMVNKSQFSIYSGKAANTLSGLHTPTVDFRAVVKVSGGKNNTGSVTITGTLDGKSNSEILDFSEADTKDSTILIDTITSITTSGMANEDPKPDLSILAVDFQGTPIMSETAEEISVRFEQKVTSYESSPGVWSMSQARAFTDPNISFVVGDKLRYNSQDYFIKNIITRSDLDGIAEFKLLQLGG